MKTGDEVYIKSNGEMANRHKIKAKLFRNAYKLSNGGCHFGGNLRPISPTDRLVSELPEIAKMTRCYVAVDHDKDIVLSESKMKVDEGLWFTTGKSEALIGTITCPNCKDFTRQWGPDGELV